MRRSGLHQYAPFLEQVAARAGLGLVPDRMRKRRLHDRMRRMGPLGRIVPKARPEPVRDRVDTLHPSYRRCGSLAKFRPEARKECR